jgi:hypothetical protein
MPTTRPIVFAPEDEKQFFEFLQRFHLTFYPERIPPDHVPMPVRGSSQESLTEPAYYLAAEELGPIEARMIKKGPERGWQEIDETNSPVIHYERSVVDDLGQLRSGRLWTEVNLTGDARRLPAFPDAYRRMWVQIREHIVSRCLKSEPAGFFIGPQAARLARSGTVLREAGRKGGLLRPFR